MTAVRWAVVPALALTVTGFGGAPAAVATPSVGVEAVTLSQSTEDGVDYVIREITIAPGGSTGWHYHHGQVFGVIEEGTLTHDAANCTVDGVYPPDASINEESGPDHVHIGRNLGPTPLVITVVYIQPTGLPLSEDAPDPGCGFA
ncbi:cupin domain-containing protein [Mycolicibacterium sp. XJ662]